MVKHPDRWPDAYYWAIDQLAEVIAATGASVKEIVHDRAFSGPDLSAVRVVCVVETTGHDHVCELHDALAKSGMAVVG